tara:strand:- start:2275 stop:2985 length:711 start_codon:yes stop_codon:yes gene_type:complete
MLTPEQQQLFSQSIQQLGPDFLSSLGGFLQPQSQEDMEATFQKSFVDPAMQTFEQKTIPGIQQAYGDANAGSSSALNQALAQSAGDLSTSLGSQFGQYQQNQQQLQQNAIGQFLPLMSQSTFNPMMQEQQGLAGPIINAIGNIGGGWARSSHKVKENIRGYKKSLETLKDLTVKQYDYIEEVGGEKDRVGLIAETLPTELTKSIDGILHVDVYGVVGLLINTIKELNDKVVLLEAR